MAVPSFLFGGNTNETPQSIKQKRDLIRAMMGASAAPRNVGEGLNALGDGILANVLDRRANAAEAAGTSAANSLFNSIMGGAPAPTPGAAGPSMPAVSSSGDAAPGPQSYRDAIASIESKGSGDYSAVGPTSPKLGRALGRYQVMEANIAPWSREALGREVTPAEFLASPQLQDQIFDKKFGGYVQQFGPQGAAQAWFAGPGGVGKLDRKDSLGTSVAAYADKFGRAIGGPTQVASNDPSIGMPAAASAIEKTAPGSGYVDPRVANVGPQQTQAAPPLSPPVNVAANPVPPQAPQQMAQAAPQDRFGGVDPRLLQALQNPWLNEGQKASIQLLIQQQQQQAQQAAEQQTWQSRQDYLHQQSESDPDTILGRQVKQAQLKALENKTGEKEPLLNAGNGQIYDPNSKTWITPPNASGNGGGFRFGGNSVEAQSLNGLIDSGAITPDQAQQLGAGKTVTGPNGEILFLTPQGIFKQPGQTQAAQPQQQGIDLFGGDSQGQNVGQPTPETAGTPTPAANQTIQITAPKQASNEQLSASSFADRMHNAGQTLDQNEKQGLNGFDQFMTNSPFVPSIIGNTVVGHSNPDYQVYDRAKRDFINAQLRRESGAVIGKDEFDSAEKQYFPQPGDSQNVIDDKRRARQLAIDSMARSAGPNYKRPQPSGNSDIQAAKDAIAKGAPREAVIKRLQDAGIDTTGL